MIVKKAKIINADWFRIIFERKCSDYQSFFCEGCKFENKSRYKQPCDGVRLGETSILSACDNINYYYFYYNSRSDSGLDPKQKRLKYKYIPTRYDIKTI